MNGESIKRRFLSIIAGAARAGGPHAVGRFGGGKRAHLAAFYSSTGRPSIDPELLVRMLIVGYCFGIRSERRLYEEVHLNLAYRLILPIRP